MSEKQSLGTMISGVTQDISTLLRGEIELVKAEISQQARTAAQGSGLLVGAAVVAGTAALFLLLTLAWLLDEWLPTWAAFGIVTLLLIITAVILGLVGRKQLERIKGLEASPASIEKTKAVLTRKPIPDGTTTTAGGTTTSAAPRPASSTPSTTTGTTPATTAAPASGTPSASPKP
ncbi:MAG: phage holin family protein [Candidatus Nanopelagicales bacterium]